MDLFMYPYYVYFVLEYLPIIYAFIEKTLVNVIIKWFKY